MSRTKLTVTVDVKEPAVPNFLAIVDREESIDVADIDDADLQKIGESWTAELLENARKRRAVRGAK